MEFMVDFSLVYDASIAVVTTVWYRQYITNQIFEEEFLTQHHFEARWQDVEDIVVANLQQLTIPETTKDILLNLAQPIGKQLHKWLEFHTFLNLRELKLSDILVWKTPGIIDMKLTADKIIQNEKLCVVNRFRLACINCKDVDVFKLWPEVRSNFLDRSSNWLNLVETTEIMFWICYIEEKVEELMEFMEYYENNEFIQFAAWAAVMNNNNVAAKYFIEQLESHHLARLVKNSIHYVVKNRLCCNPSLLAFLLSQLSQTDQQELFIAQSENILILFLNWPLQYSFLKIASNVWESLTPLSYYNVVDEIVRKISEFHWGCHYRNIFREFWNLAPLRFRSYVIQKCINATFLSRIFSLKGTDDIIMFLLREFSDDQKKQMLLEFNGRQVIDFLLSKNRWQSLTLFLTSCATTQADIYLLKDVYFEHIKKVSYIIIEEKNLKQFADILETLSDKMTFSNELNDTQQLSLEKINKS